MKLQLILPWFFAEQMPDGSAIDKGAVQPWMPAIPLKTASECCYEQQLMKALGQAADKPGLLPIANCLNADADADVKPTSLVCAQPVHLEASHDDARLLPPQCLSLSATESNELIAALNELWNPDSIVVSAHSATSWQISGQDAHALDCLPTSMLAYLSVAEAMPRTSEAASWRQLLTEAQMVLFEHPVNISRAQRGLRSVNSIWCYGGAALQALTPINDTTVVSNNNFAQGLANHLSLPHTDLAHFDIESVAQHHEHQYVIVDARLQEAWLASDHAQFVELRDNIIKQTLQPASQANLSNKTVTYSLDDCFGNLFQARQSMGLVERCAALFKRALTR